MIALAAVAVGVLLFVRVSCMHNSETIAVATFATSTSQANRGAYTAEITATTTNCATCD